MNKNNERRDPQSGPPPLKPAYSAPVTTGVLFALLVMLALPLSQYITDVREDFDRRVEIIDFQPPEIPPEPPPPDQPEEEVEIDDVQEQREPPTLDQLEMMLNPDVSGLAGGDFTVPEFAMAGTLDDMIFELGDLSRHPEPIFQPSPTYPPELRSARTSGEVMVQFVVGADGTTRDIRILSSSNPAFEEPTIRALRRWRFEPGERDGQPVNTWVRQRIPFRFGS